jgi:hypothetical protein
LKEPGGMELNNWKNDRVAGRRRIIIKPEGCQWLYSFSLLQVLDRFSIVCPQ